MSDLIEMKVRDFVAAVGAKVPAPGGGAVAGMCGALAGALGAMALEYTVGKKAFVAHDGEIRAALAEFQKAAVMLQELMAEDAAAFEALGPYFKLTPEQRTKEPGYLPAVVAAIRVPQTVGGFALHILEQCEKLTEKTNKMLISDLGIAAVYAHATVHASEMNVRVNLPLLPNTVEAEGVAREVREMCLKADRIYGPVREKILGMMR